MNRKKISLITAAVLSIGIAAGCSNVGTDIQSYDSSVSSESSFSETETAAPASSEAPSSETSAETASLPETALSVTETEESSSEEDAENEETSESEPETVSESASETSAARSWSETNRTATMYIVEDCVGRESADNSSTIVTKYVRGDRVEIAALTDSGFYKIKGGGYIHNEYLSDNAVTEASSEAVTVTSEEQTEETTAKTTSKKKETEKSSKTETETEPALPPASDTELSVSDKKYADRYAYKQLSDNEKKLYLQIYSAVENFEDTVVTDGTMDKNTALKVYMTVYNQEPQLFWMGSSVTINGNTIILKYLAKKDEAAEMKKKIDANTAPVLAKVNAADTTYEKLRIIYESIIGNNDASVSNDGYNATIYNAFTDNGDIQCAGYAKAVQYLCDLSGIDSIIAVGKNNEGGSHAWNVVYCGDGYYNLDCTWGDPVNNYDSRYIRYTYFLVPDSDIHGISHLEPNCFYTSDGTKIKCFDLPSCKSTKYNYYRQEGLYFSDKKTAENAIKAAIKKAVANKENTVQIRVSSGALFDELTSKEYAVIFQKYAKSLSPSVKGCAKFTAETYRTTGVVIYDINYNS